MEHITDIQAGPSKLKTSQTPQKKPRKATPSTPVINDDGDDSGPANAKAISGPATGGQGDEEEEGEERMDFKLIQSFADKIQLLPTADDVDGLTSRPQIIIPRRGEKDFEPLQETANLQEMMLEKSRQALFNALTGVRGGHNNSISHALLTPKKPFPRVLVVHGHLLDTMGITVRTPPPAGSKGKGKTSLELLPEEALYLLERGSLQIWIGKDPETDEEVEAGVGEWCDEEYGVKGAIEMSVMEGFGAFIGREGLTWERYQAYSYLKRLGYNVQRSRQFIPEYFLAAPSVQLDEQDPRLPPFNTWWLNIPKWIVGFFKVLARGVQYVAGKMARVGLGLRLTRDPFKGTLLNGWKGSSYNSLFSYLRVVPAGHNQPLPPRPSAPPSDDIYAPLIHNPYIPFWHIWKPMTLWSKRNWDKGSEEGLKTQRPDYFAAVIQARITPLPTIHQLEEIYAMLPDEPKGPIKRYGPQYQRPPRPQVSKPQTQTPAQIPSRLQSLLEHMGWKQQAKTKPQAPSVNVGALRNGDRGFIVGVNDSGNNAWIRFGRTDFSQTPAI
ncbi:tRNA-splicing endonuclease subunit Sen54 [Cryptococcus neoformans Bt1]|nr:tRNA-splicing endonuclease subunit Sen54 [Cryptococcus neoformans var. grubii Bt1]